MVKREDKEKVMKVVFRLITSDTPFKDEYSKPCLDLKSALRKLQIEDLDNIGTILMYKGKENFDS